MAWCEPDGFCDESEGFIQPGVGEVAERQSGF